MEICLTGAKITDGYRRWPRADEMGAANRRHLEDDTLLFWRGGPYLAGFRDLIRTFVPTFREFTNNSLRPTWFLRRREFTGKNLQ
jgi:hypothetical protein